MIFLQNVTKIYKAKKVKDCLAINDVSFTLPEKGLVFIVGKSGSGKSTLLNLIGGLDNCTKGSIIYNGNDITNLKYHDLNNYRSMHVGFVFQDYHVLNNLTTKKQHICCYFFNDFKYLSSFALSETYSPRDSPPKAISPI